MIATITRRTLIQWLSIGVAATLSGCASDKALSSREASHNVVGQPLVDIKERKADDPALLKTAVETRTNEPSTFALSIPAPAGEYPLDLTTALHLAEVENPLIAEARQRIGEALAVRQGARALLVPTLNVGANLHTHTGNVERSSGRILNLNENSLYLGGGAGAVATGTPQVPAVVISTQLTDALFEPLAAGQRLEGTRFRADATANQVLLEVAELHLDSAAAETTLQARQEALRQSEIVARLTRSYAEAQQGRAADAERAATVRSLIEVEARQAEEEAAVNEARLARRLHLDQAIRLKPLPLGTETVVLTDPGLPLTALIAAAIENRPEVTATNHDINAAEIKHREEVYRPLLPNLWIAFSGGAMGGGSNLVPPYLSHFAGRNDFDIRVYWTVQNLGLGNHSLQKRRWAELGQAVSDRSSRIAQTRTEVSAAYAERTSARQRIDLATKQLESAEKGFREDLLRIENTVGRPIELVNSLELLNTARVARIRAINDYNKAEFRLFVALGSPPPLGENANAPFPPAPVASPPLPALL